MDIGKLKSQINGCWLGKNIGGTLGAPFEGSPEIRNISFYTQKDLYGKPVPNDDLDLQLAWLTLIEYYGLYRLNSRLMGEYWLNNIIGPWNEYAVCRWNCRHGFYPPLSGSCNNDNWKWSNGAWIRSEIWACMFPGDPDSALRFAWLDASADHTGEGIYAEMFTVALEAAAFVEKDLRKLIDIGLSKVPENSRIYGSIKLVCESFDAGEDWKTAREKVVELNSDLGFFQAPANVSFAIIGLLYGGGDFGKTICTAVNCGDDTDCSAATAGAIMGILLGEENLPEEWIKPIGRSIVSCAINTHSLPQQIPDTIDELTARILKQLEIVRTEFPDLNQLPEDLCSKTEAERIWKKSSYELMFPVSWAEIGVEYLDGPWIELGVPCRIKFHVHSPVMAMSEVKFRWRLPEGWSSTRQECEIGTCYFCDTETETEVTASVMPSEVSFFLELEVSSDDRLAPQILFVPFRKKGVEPFPKLKKDSEIELFQKVSKRTHQFK